MSKQEAMNDSDNQQSVSDYLTGGLVTELYIKSRKAYVRKLQGDIDE